MMEPLNKIESTTYQQLSNFHRIFNKTAIPRDLHVFVQLFATGEWKVYEVSQLYQKAESLDIHSQVKLCGCRPWVDFLFKDLDLTIGKHIYKISLARIHGGSEVRDLFFSYTIQDDSPNKPYIYMDRDKA